MKDRMERRLSYLISGETFAIIMFPIIYAVSFFAYQDLKLHFLFSFWLSFFLLEFILLQGSLYWRVKLKQLKKESSIILPQRVVRTLQVLETANGGLLLLTLLFFVIDFLIWYPNIPFKELSITGCIFIFAFLEYVNYFYIQLSYDNISDLKFLIRTRRLKEAYIKKDIRRSSSG
ncbi:hypothetical protein [Priestia filamentosa]|uniref:hypothetical protein n=1 Tax=Priestia filamentosa TaxID=1402861 RepID=UPI00030B2A73|nr:hypothetical protein [Priestia filamentosa]